MSWTLYFCTDSRIRGTQTTKCGESLMLVIKKKHLVFKEHSTVCAISYSGAATYTGHTSVPARHRKMETSFLKEYNKLCRACLQQHLVYQKLLFQPVLLAALEMQWCPTAIWLGLLPSSYLHWLIEPLPPKYWRYTEQSLRKCMWLEQIHTRWPCKIAVRRKVSHWADASFILEKQLPSCHFPLTHLLGEHCLF